MKKAIKQKLINMVDINHSDPIIQCSIGAKNIDIAQLIPNEDLNLFISGEMDTIELSVSKLQSYLEKALKATTNVSEFQKVVSEHNLQLTDYRLELLQKNFAENKIKTIKVMIEQQNSAYAKLSSLNKIAKSYYEDSSVYPLFIATDFIQGRTPTYYTFKSPLKLFRVEVRLDGGNLLISKMQDEPVLNEKLLVYLKKEFNYEKISVSELLSINTEEALVSNIEAITEKEVGPVDQTIVPFAKVNFEQDSKDYNKLEIEHSVLLGIYEPDGGLLKEDLKWMIDNEVDPFEAGKDEKNRSVEFYEEKVIKEQSIVEVGNPLNIYQKYAIASSLHQNTLIYGPPGTGKSEIIANLIFNILLKGKNTILVSEKRAALDVITERINIISNFSLPIHDLKNKDEFYNKIDDLNQLLGQQWYREKTKGGGKNIKIDPIVFTREESMFLKNYQDWYAELISLFKKHWVIEDYMDGIYKLDYSEYMKLRKELGEQLIKEWLSYDENRRPLIEEVNQVMIDYNFTKVEDLIESYYKFIKLVKKFNLNENSNSKEVKAELEKMIRKMTSNIDLVESYLTGQKKWNDLIEKYNEFLDNYNYDESTYNDFFFSKSIKEKRAIIEKTINYLEFHENVIEKDYLLGSKNLTEIAQQYNAFYNKHKKILEKPEWLEFIIDNKDKIHTFLNIYNQLPDDAKKIFFAEFIDNATLLPTDELEISSTLSMKQISLYSKEANEFISLFNDFVANPELFGKPRINEILNYQDLLAIDVKFLKDLVTVKNAFTNEMQEIYKEKEWLQTPYLKVLYLDNFVLFDTDKIDHIMKKVSTSITTDHLKKLKVILFWEKTIKNNEFFSETKGVFIQDIIMQLRRESYRSAKIIEEIAFKRYIQNLRIFLAKLPQAEKDEIATIFKLASAKNNLPAPTKFITHFYNGLRKLFPIWIARPDNVATIVPLKENEFDYGIFDEASQMTIERAYPVIYRCAKKIVAGDDKQLKPTSFFKTRINDAEYDIDDFDKADSLLDRAKTAWWNEYHLKNHYRSWSKNLIEFSNKYIYNNNLEIASRSDYLGNAIEVINVNGVWDTVNQKEADVVLQLIEQNWMNFGKILVITFNAKQATLVENMIMEKYNHFEDGLKHKIDNFDIVISNLENVQGNEGDLVILSVAYGRNPEGNIRSNFGPLINHGGLNRLNVAITRARQKMVVVKSLMGNDIKLSNSNNQNLEIFKKFMEYIDALSTQESIDDKLSNAENIVISEFSSPILQEIYGELIAKFSSKYNFMVDLDIGSKKIDLAILEKNSKKIVKAIILEKWQENKNYQSMIEDIDRQYFLEQRGYSTFRIKEYEWYTDKEKIISKIKESLTKNNLDTKIDYVLWQHQNN